MPSCWQQSAYQEFVEASLVRSVRAKPPWRMKSLTCALGSLKPSSCTAPARSAADRRAIVEHGSFAAAAQAVGCTPSAVSLQVKQVETRQAAVRPLDAAGRAEGRPA
jgi:hypothetical protein